MPHHSCKIASHSWLESILCTAAVDATPLPLLLLLMHTNSTTRGRTLLLSVCTAHLSRHCAGVRPTMGAMVRHCVGMSLARCSSFSSSSRVHSVFLMLGSNHSYLQAGHTYTQPHQGQAHDCCDMATA